MKVFVTREIPDAGLELLKQAGCTLTVYTDKINLDRQQLIHTCKTQDALLSAGPNLLDANFFEECNNLKVVSLHSAGFDRVDINAANKFKIPVSNTPDVLSKATSDVAFLLMIAVSRKALYMYKKILDGEWGFFDPTADLGVELYNKTLGVFGLGKIGVEMATKCKAAYNMKIIYNNRKPNETAEKTLDAQYVSFDELLAQSDVLSVHANLSDETKGIFNKASFGKMKPTAIFINTARGGLHDEKDLLHALQNNIIWGTGLDVTDPEPMAKDDPLLFMPNVCVLPHIGSATVETRDAMATMAAKNIIAGLKGERLPNIINPEVYQ